MNRSHAIVRADMGAVWDASLKEREREIGYE
jgi:hypothetical protein